MIAQLTAEIESEQEANFLFVLLDSINLTYEFGDDDEEDELQAPAR